MSCVVCRVSCVVCRVSCVVCRVSCVACRVSVMCQSCASHVPVMCQSCASHVSVMCQSCVSHVSHVTCHRRTMSPICALAGWYRSRCFFGGIISWSTSLWGSMISVTVCFIDSANTWRQCMAWVRRHALGTVSHSQRTLFLVPCDRVGER